MHQGFGLNYNSNFYMVRDSGHVPPGMDCLQLQLQPHQLRTQPFHYLINEQAKSLLALQELQNEVGALLEFRDLVMETFPNLRQKMSGSGSHNFSNSQNYCSNLPLPLSGSLNSRHWEPGIKVKRKIVNKNENETSFVRVRSNSQGSKIQSSQPKSSEAISGVQDSGFSTETNSSNKDHASSTATSVPLPVQTDDPFLARKEPTSHKDSRRSEYDRSDEELSEDGMVLKVNEAEEELWNLLDIIHTKGTKLREEVETLQLRLMVEEIENHLKEKELEIRKGRRKFGRRCRSLDNMGDVPPSPSVNSVETDTFLPHFKFGELSFEDDLFSKKRARSIELEDVENIRQERNMLLHKLAEMETENMANRLKTSELQNEISALISTKEELQEQLFQAVKQKTELNSKIHELHMKFVTGDRKYKGKHDKAGLKDLTDSESSQSEVSSLSRSKSDDTHQTIQVHGGHPNDVVDHFTKFSQLKNLGFLDGIITNPKDISKHYKLSEGTRKKLKAILKEKNYLELQRHLLVFVVQNQILSNELQVSMKSKDDLFDRLEKYRKENDELLFKLEERNIELEGTRAHVRQLEKMQHQSRNSFDTRLDPAKSGENFTFLENDHLRLKGFSESEINRARQIFLESQNKKVDRSEIVKILNRTKNSAGQKAKEPRGGSFDLGKTSNVIPILALPVPAMASHQSSGTESTHALEISSELEADMVRADKCDSLKNDKSPQRRRPSKIPLNIQKTSKSLKSGANDGQSLLKKSDSEINKSKDLNTSLKKLSLDNSQNSISSRSPPQNPNSIKYTSVGRTSSQLSIASQKSHTSNRGDKRKSLTGCQKEETSLSSTKNLSLKQTTNFSNIRQRDTLSRKSQNEPWETSGKKTIRSSLRESFRSRRSIDGNGVPSMSGRKDSLSSKQNRSNPAHQKASSNKSILPPETENTKCEDCSTDGVVTSENASSVAEYPEESKNDQSGSDTPEQDSDIFSDSLNSSVKQFKPEKPNLLKGVRESFQRRLSEKFSQTFSNYKLLSPLSVFHNLSNRSSQPQRNVWNCPRYPNDHASGDVGNLADLHETPEAAEINFFDSIDNALDIDRDDSLLINSSYYPNDSFRNEAMAELDSLDIKTNHLD